jgi:glycosyltransferase involved in cell wall biosynthesis
MQKNTPFFSILIPSFNRPELIKETLESIYTQDISLFEVIVSDDASPKANQILKATNEFKNKYTNFNSYFQDSNLKEPGNKNYLVDRAIGDYIIFLGDDDLLEPDSLIQIKNLLENNKDIDLLLLGYKIINENGEVISTNSVPRFKSISSKEWIKAGSLFFDHFPFWYAHPASFCCRNNVEKIFPYSQDVGIGEDIFFLSEVLISEKKVAVSDIILFNWRKELDSKREQINQSSDPIKNIIARLKIYNFFLNYRIEINKLPIKDNYFLWRFVGRGIQIIRDEPTKASLEIALSQYNIENMDSKISFLPKYSYLLLIFIDLYKIFGLRDASLIFFRRLRNSLK